MAAKVSKLDEQFRLDAPREKQKEGSCSNIFSGVSIYVNGYTGKTTLQLNIHHEFGSLPSHTSGSGCGVLLYRSHLFKIKVHTSMLNT